MNQLEQNLNPVITAAWLCGLLQAYFGKHDCIHGAYEKNLQVGIDLENKENLLWGMFSFTNYACTVHSFDYRL